MNPRTLSAAVLATVFASLSLSAQDQAVTFETHVLPILEKNCIECHRTEYVDEKGKKVRPKGGLVLDTKAGIMAGRKKKPVIVAGKPESSIFYKVVTLADDDEYRMPPPKQNEKEEVKAALSAADKETLKNWIAGGTELDKMFGTWEGKPSGGAKKAEEKKDAAEAKKGGAEGERPTREEPAGEKPAGDKPAGTPPAGGRGE